MDNIIKYLSENINEKGIIKLIINMSSSMTADIIIKNNVKYRLHKISYSLNFMSSLSLIDFNNKTYKYFIRYWHISNGYNNVKFSLISYIVTNNNYENIKIIDENYNKNNKKTNILIINSEEEYNNHVLNL